MNAPLAVAVPLHSTEAEQGVLGSLLLDNGAIDRIDCLDPEDFYYSEHKVTYAVIRQMISRGIPADVISVADALQHRQGVVQDGLFAHLNQMAQNTPSAANIGRYARIVRDYALRRRILTATADAAELARSPSGMSMSAEAILDVVLSKVTSLAEQRTRTAPKMLCDLLDDFVKAAESRAEGTDAAIPTGLEPLDRVLGGGLRAGQLVVIAGRPAMGKSAFSTHIGLNMAARHSVLMFSMEMSSPELVGRAMANRGGLPLSRLMQTLAVGDSRGQESFFHARANLHPMRFAIDETAAISLLELRTKAKAWKRRHGLDVIIVDYLGLMSGGEGDKRTEQIGSYSRGLKALAKELDVAIIALAQLNRKSEDRLDRKPLLSDLRDSGEIEQDADIVAFIHRPEMYDTNNMQLRGYAEVLLRKQRNGPMAEVSLKFDGATCRFEEWSGDTPTHKTANTYQKRRFE